MKKGLLTWIQYAIKLEEKSVSFYDECYKKAKEHYTEELFKFLIEEESRHVKTLTQVFSAVANGNKEKLKKDISNFKKIKIKSRLYTKEQLKDIIKTKMLTDVLNKAIGLEEKAASLYSKLEEKETNKDIKSFFKRLVRDEKDHKKIIKDFGISLVGDTKS